MKFENIHIYNFENALRGMRNPKNSWDKTDSQFGYGDFDTVADLASEYSINWVSQEKWEQMSDQERDEAIDNIFNNIAINADINSEIYEYAAIGPDDMRLAKTLIRSGPEHRKFLRQIMVSVDITAPLYWWKEFDTYKVGTVANSTSTMHKLTSKPITMSCFEIDDYDEDLAVDKIPYTEEGGEVFNDPEFTPHWHIDMFWDKLIQELEELRQMVLKTEDPTLKKKYWKELVRVLPEAWLQTRTVTLNYENLLAMCSKGQRRFHKLTEWSSSFIGFARSLPYAQDFIFIDETE